MKEKVRIFTKIFIFTSIITNFFLFLPNAFAKQNDIVGKWQTIDDKTHQARSIIEITSQGKKYQGKIVGTYRKTDHLLLTKRNICHDCKGKYRNKDLIGEKIIWGLYKKRSNHWDNGRIVDPSTGRVYRVSMSLSDEGKKLRVHGYIGIPLLGRTQVWNRFS